MATNQLEKNLTSNPMLKLAEKVELEAQATTMEWGEEWKQLPQGYLDGMLWAFDLILMWINQFLNYHPEDLKSKKELINNE